MAEEFSRFGCVVTGIDPSKASIETARQHAREQKLSITYEVASGEDLPFADKSFDVVYCCDVLEHVEDVDKVIEETARMIKKDGLYFYDTINRTFKSWFLMIKLTQDWQITSVVPPNLHSWQKFVKPEELQHVMDIYNLKNKQTIGLAPHISFHTIKSLFELKRRQITYAEFGRRAPFQETNDLSASYMGYAIKS
jgi:2-polyprenyl-6-hydroxyphenyl methylase/3-demethylubiquinone-9 3-methyltransferase